MRASALKIWEGTEESKRQGYSGRAKNKKTPFRRGDSSSLVIPIRTPHMLLEDYVRLQVSINALFLHWMSSQQSRPESVPFATYLFLSPTAAETSKQWESFVLSDRQNKENIKKERAGNRWKKEERCCHELVGEGKAEAPQTPCFSRTVCNISIGRV